MIRMIFKLKPDEWIEICYNRVIDNRKGWWWVTVFEKAYDVDLMAVVAIDETFDRNDVDSIDVMDKSEIRQIFRKD